jgi:hypothetical protein
MPRRGTNAMHDYAVTVPEAGETSYLVAPHIVSPFFTATLAFFFVLIMTFPAFPPRLPPNAPFPIRHSLGSLQPSLKVLRPFSLPTRKPYNGTSRRPHSYPR